MAITYKAKYGSKYNNDYDKNDIINLKTYGDIFKFEKKRLNRVLRNQNNGLYLIDNIINIKYLENALGNPKTSTGYVTFYGLYSLKEFNIKENSNITTFNRTMIAYLNRYSYFVITPEFAKQLEKEKKFYIGTWDDVKDYIITPDDKKTQEKYINIYE